MPDVTVITGASGGLGLTTARHLLHAGRDVVLIGRDAARTAAAARTLRGPTADVRTYVADLTRQAEVRGLAARLAEDGPPIGVLINNAGAAFSRYEQTPEGAERTYAVNHHAPFLLTHTLLASGALTADARIINVSSFVEKRGKLDREDPDVSGTSWATRLYSQIHVYATSKLLNLLAGSELARRLPAGMRVYHANPGMVKDTGFNAGAGGLMRLTAPLLRPFAITPDEGVQTITWLATTPQPPHPSGGFYTTSRPGTPSRQAQDLDLASLVYERTASMLGLSH
ncbi:SDR family NAD(P)-dependent oxidoreductase [Nonomuraea sp. NPDC050540]|uniref:SDR family NAD(P)-dependent oxidoreductase n=1 Tax=Nonomuraea sp. NPDC050540 TaxID=3364367 RepID=UPI0037AFDC53